MSYFNRPNRELQAFSAAAIDLFASALGAFLIIGIIALPYYLKSDPERQEAMEAEIEALQADLQQKNEKIENLVENEKIALLGIETTAKSFAIVIDLSGSMSNFTLPVQTTTGKIIDSLDADAELTIYGYQGDGPPQPQFRWPNNGLTPMSPPAKNQAKSAIVDMLRRVNGGTPTLAAMQSALREPVEAIILVTDGQPNTPWRTVSASVTSQNAGRKEIHVVGVGQYWDDPTFLQFLIQLSRNNGGELVAATR